jgi:hypothetical protein
MAARNAPAEGTRRDCPLSRTTLSGRWCLLETHASAALALHLSSLIKLIQWRQHPETACRESLTLHFPLNVKLHTCSPLARAPPKFATINSTMNGAIAESGLACTVKLCCVRGLQCTRFLTGTLLAAATGLAGCTSDGTPASTGDSGSIGSFVHNLFRSKSEDQPPGPHNEVPPVAHNVTPVEPSAPKKKSVASKPKQSTVAVARVPKEEARAQPQSPPESAAPALSGAAPVLATGSFDNRVGSRR